jgi:hypothetical protein
MDVTSHAPYPAGPEGLIQFTQLVSMGIMDYSDHIEEAKSLLRYLGTESVWIPLAVDGFAFYYPLFRGLEDNPAMPWNYDPKLAAFKGLMEVGHTFGWPAAPSAAASEVAVNYVLVDMFGSYAAGAASLDEAIATAVEQIEDIYSS